MLKKIIREEAKSHEEILEAVFLIRKEKLKFILKLRING